MDLARGRAWSEVTEEWESDPLGSFLAAGARVPFLGWSAFMVSGIIEKARQWLGHLDIGVGYQDAMAAPGVFGLTGSEVSLNTMLGAFWQWMTLPADLAMGYDVTSSRYFKASKGVPIPLRPVIAASVGLLAGEQAMQQRNGNGPGGRHFRSTLGYLGSSGMGDVPASMTRTDPEVRQNREKKARADREDLAKQLGNTRKPKPQPKPKISQASSPSLTEQATGFREMPDTPDLTVT
jgi:hypothetical protein